MGIYGRSNCQSLFKIHNQLRDPILCKQFYTWEAFFECLSHTGIRLCLEIMLENKNVLRLFKNHFPSLHKFISTQHTNLFSTAVQQLSNVVLVCTNTLLPFFVHSLTSLLRQHCRSLGCVLHGPLCTIKVFRLCVWLPELLILTSRYLVWFSRPFIWISRHSV